MDCKKTDEYFMKYMDGILNEHEAGKLHEHINNCVKCKEDFLVYDRMLIDFSEIDIINAPDDFESAVMIRIEGLGDIVARVENRLDSIIWGVWGTFSVLMGGGFILSMYKEPILGYLSSNPEFEGYLNILSSASEYVNRLTTDITSAIDTFSVTAADYLNSFRYGLLLIFFILAVVQYTIYRRDKVEV